MINDRFANTHGPCLEAERGDDWNRRAFMKGLSALVGSAGLLGYDLRRAAAEPPPETTKLRLFQAFPTCLAPQYIAQELLYGEGFTDVRYVNWPDDTKLWPPDVLLSGEVDISLSFPPQDIIHIDAGAPVVILAGSHSGCVEVVASDKIRSTPELKGKAVAISWPGSDEHIFISMFAAYVGLNPQKDINWVNHPHPEQPRLLAERKIDAFFSGPPESLELREKKIGHVLITTTTDKPWSQYHCCLAASTREFVGRHPVATKRALRAILKASDICAREPKRVAQFMADQQLARYEIALQTLQELSYGKWREYDPEDALRFYALRMREVGIIKSTPQKIIAQGTDWRFLNELKKELKV